MEINFNDGNFEDEVINSKEPVLVDFWAEWCSPCRVQGPIINELANEMKGRGIKIGKLNVDESQITSQKFNIMSIPTLMIFKDGKVVSQMVGVQQKSNLRLNIEKILNNK